MDFNIRVDWSSICSFYIWYSKN